MLDETRTIEGDAELVRPRRAAYDKRHKQAKRRSDKPVPANVEIPPTREIILRLIELLKQM